MPSNEKRDSQLLVGYPYFSLLFVICGLEYPRGVLGNILLYEVTLLVLLKHVVVYLPFDFFLYTLGGEAF